MKTTILILFIILACIIFIIVLCIRRLNKLMTFGEEHDAVNTEDDYLNPYL